MEICERTRSFGWTPGQRRPCGALRSFMGAWDWGSLSLTSHKMRAQCVRRWHNTFVSSRYASAVAEAV
eukprot:2641025-Pyramimonas_sp.AAC.1